MILRIGILSVAHMHAYSYASSINALATAELCGIADDNPERGQSAAEQFATKFVPSYAELLASEIDAVVIGSENIRHRELVEMAAAAGKHVLCEKPLATTYADGLAMIDACRAAGVQLMTAFPCRFSPAAVRLKSAVDSGAIGNVLAIRGTNRGRCPFDWFTQLDLSGGGAVIDHTVHVTDLMRWILGTEVTQVYAEISHRMFGQSFEDTGFLSLRFANGVFATLDSSWSRCKSYPTWGDVTLAVTGEKGTLTLDMFSQNLVHYSDRTGGVSWIPWGSNIDELMLDAFVKAIVGEAPVPITGEDGLAAAAVALAAYRSAAAGAPTSPERAA